MKNSFIPVTMMVLLGCACVGTASAADKWQNITMEQSPELAGNEIQFIKPMAGETWVGTLSGVSVYRGGSFVSVKRGEKKASIQVWDILKIATDRYAVGTGRGLYMLDQGGLSEPLLAGKAISPIVRFGKKSLWALAKDKGTEVNTVYEESNGTWTPVDVFAQKRVADMVQTSDGKIWVIIDGDGVIEVDPAKGTKVMIHHQQGLNVQTIFRDSKGRIWCGMWGRGVAVLENGKWTSYLSNEKSAVVSMTEDKAGHIWVATNASGAWCYDGESWKRFLTDEGLINLLYATSDGKVWVSSQMQGGLRYWDGTSWLNSLETGLPIKCVVESQNGDLWAGGVLDGVHLLRKK